jgi:hypothetical protein
MNKVTLNGGLGKMEALLARTSSLATLASRLHSEVREAFEALEIAQAANLREAGRRYLATASNRELRQDLIAARGGRAAAHLRTKLNSDLEMRRGRRHPVSGSPLVSNGSNGSAHHAV